MMLTRWIRFISAILIIGWTLPANALSQTMSNNEIVKELKALKERIHGLEEELNEKDQEIERLQAETMGREEVPNKMIETELEGSFLSEIQEHICISGLLEFGGAREGVDYRDGTGESQSDLNLTTVELNLEAGIMQWVHATTTFLYEDATFGDETDVGLDVGTVTIGNTEEFPLYFTGGAMYVPFGALLTHFPDDPLMNQPLTLVLGETREKAALFGLESRGFSLSGYVFNGDLDESGGGNHAESFGFDANCDYADEKGLGLMVGASYLSNIADSDGLTGELQDNLGVNTIREDVGGFAAYVHLCLVGCFLDAEFMTATRDFDPAALATGQGDGARPAVWNLEAGYLWNWGKDLEIALKYAGSDESENLGFPEARYGLALNQSVLEGVIASVAFLHDTFDDDDRDGRDDRNVVYGQVAVDF